MGGTSDLYSILPAGTRYRELWLPELINSNATLPSSIASGHPLTLTGARKGTTADGVHFYGDAASNINCGAIHNNAATLWISFRFKLDQPFSVASPANQLPWGKRVDATHQLRLQFNSTNGHLDFIGLDGGVNDFDVQAQDGGVDITSWEAGRWYHVLASISAANDVRFIIDNGTVVTVVTAIAAPNGGNFIIGDLQDPGSGNGFEGVIADFCCGTGDLTVAEEADAYNGIPPAAATEEYLLDEGRGVTAYNRGSSGAGADGTLDTSPTWAFGQVQQPVISFDGINDVAISSAGVDIGGDLTFVWVGKVKSTYNELSTNRMLVSLSQGGEYIILYSTAGGSFRLLFSLGAIAVTSLIYPTIDDYIILIGTQVSGVIALYTNGTLVGVNIGATPFPHGNATVYIGRYVGVSGWDISKPLLVGLIEGAFTQQQARAFSKLLNELLGLGLTI